MKNELSHFQMSKLADIAADIGTVAYASILLPDLLGKFRPLVAGLGLLIMLLFWSLSIILLKLK